MLADELHSVDEEAVDWDLSWDTEAECAAYLLRDLAFRRTSRPTGGLQICSSVVLSVVRANTGHLDES